MLEHMLKVLKYLNRSTLVDQIQLVIPVIHSQRTCDRNRTDFPVIPPSTDFPSFRSKGSKGPLRLKPVLSGWSDVTSTIHPPSSIPGPSEGESVTLIPVSRPSTDPCEGVVSEEVRSTCGSRRSQIFRTQDQRSPSLSRGKRRPRPNGDTFKSSPSSLPRFS